MSEKNDDFDMAEPLHPEREVKKAEAVPPKLAKTKAAPKRRGRPPKQQPQPRSEAVAAPEPVYVEQPKPSKAAEPRLRRFWKPKRSLPSVEWDQNGGLPDEKTGKPQGAARFEFKRGLFETRDQKLAAELIRKGYLEIPEGVTPPQGPPTDDLPPPEQTGLPQQVSARELFAHARLLAEQRLRSGD